MYTPDREINPPSFYEKDEDEKPQVRCALCLEYVYVFDTITFEGKEICEDCFKINTLS